MKKLAFFLGMAIAIFVSAQVASALQVIDDALQVNSLRVGQQGSGGVTYFNGTIVNSTTSDDGGDNPVTFGDNVRIDGRVYRGATAGTADDRPFLVNDNMEVAGSLTVGSTNILTQLSSLSSIDASLQSQVNGCMVQSTYDAAGNGKIDAGKLDSGISAALIGDGSVTNDEFGYLALMSVNSDNHLFQLTDYLYIDDTSSMKLTAFGYQAGNAIQTGGTDNTFIGYQCGYNVTTGDKNTGVGSGALGTASTESNLTAVGYNALTANTTGTECTAVGSDALDANTEGERNTAFGYNALGTNTTADDNVAIGHSALAATQTTANRNTAVGNYSLDAITNGVWNVALGYGTIGNGTGVDSSVALGYLALSAVSGDNNIAIGYQAGNGISSGASNIIIGYDADAPVATSSNQLNIGGSIYGDLSNDYIGVGDYSSAVPGDAMFSILQTGTVPHIELNPIGSAPTTDVSEGDVYMNTDGILYVRSNSAWQEANTAGDYSELIVPIGFNKEVSDHVRTYIGEINAGDVIVIDTNGYYARSNTAYDSAIAGVESGERGQFYLREGTAERAEGQRQIGLVGHIKVNVTLENGPIYPGDPLATSSLAGHAMKATLPGAIIGRALESFNGSQGQTGMIEVIVNPSWYGGMMLCRY